MVFCINSPAFEYTSDYVGLQIIILSRHYIWRRGYFSTKAMATLGKIQEFNPDSDSVNAYIERVNLFFVANDVAEGKRVAVFLSVIGGKT